jgi:hypothetical protein
MGVTHPVSDIAESKVLKHDKKANRRWFILYPRFKLEVLFFFVPYCMLLSGYERSVNLNSRTDERFCTTTHVTRGATIPNLIAYPQKKQSRTALALESVVTFTPFGNNSWPEISSFRRPFLAGTYY